MNRKSSPSINNCNTCGYLFPYVWLERLLAGEQTVSEVLDSQDGEDFDRALFFVVTSYGLVGC
jgi:hypothetical protein